jgi:lipopolysaccharide/colanic/teichoic acid biosynthesis glycosyltransferase
MPMAAIQHATSLLRSFVGTHALAPSRIPATTARRARTAARPIRETLFRDALERERDRADRFEEPLVVAWVARGGGRVSSDDWERVMEGVAGVMWPGDLIGWFEAGTVVGILRPAAPSVSARLDMEQRLGAVAPACLVKTEVYDPTHEVTPSWLMDELARRHTSVDVARAAVKRGIDVAGSVTMLALLAPLMLAVALLIKCTSRGPVLFRQERVGLGGRTFRMNKFRTIRADADATIHQQYVEGFIEAGARKPDGDCICKLVNDPRVTTVGRFLRRSSIDEVPQFWNVLVGEMSLVGPRPALPYEVAHYRIWHRRRFEATPGMTGLWQVSGRSRTSFDEMVQIDLRYTRNRTILNDLKILAATPRAVVSGRGAH